MLDTTNNNNLNEMGNLQQLLMKNRAQAATFENKILTSLKLENLIITVQGIFDKYGNRKLNEVLTRINGGADVIYPDQFIPVIKKHKMQTFFDNLVLEKTFKIISLSDKLKVQKYSINIFPETFEDKTFFITLKSLILKYQIDPKTISFELLEPTEYDKKYRDLIASISEKLKDYGIEISLDDVVESLFSQEGGIKLNKNLKTVKIDGDFINSLFGNPPEDNKKEWATQKLQEFVDHIKSQLGTEIIVVAEKIETKQMFETLLKNRGIDLFQGYFFERPKSLV